MLVPDDEWVYAPHLMFDPRKVLAPVRIFSRQVHENAYSIPSLATELGISVKYYRDLSLDVIGLCARKGDGLEIILNEAIEQTEHDMAGLVHELGHALIDEISILCKGKLLQVAERNAWVRGIYAAISLKLAEAILEEHLTVQEVAAKCCVPTMIVEVRVALSIILGETIGNIDDEYEVLRRELLKLEQWFEEGRERRFKDWAVA